MWSSAYAPVAILSDHALSKKFCKVPYFFVFSPIFLQLSVFPSYSETHFIPPPPPYFPPFPQGSSVLHVQLSWVMQAAFSPLSLPRLSSGVSDSLKHDNSSESSAKHITEQHAVWDPALCCCWRVHTAPGGNASSLQDLTRTIHNFKLVCPSQCSGEETCVSACSVQSLI